MGGKGLVFASGANWKELRSTTLQILREFGIGRNSLAERIRDEVSCYVDKLVKQKGEPIDVQHFTRVSVSNVICSIIFGRRFSHDDPRFKVTVESLMRLAESARGASAINFLPFLQYLPGDVFKAKTMQQHLMNVKSLLVEMISDVESSDYESKTAGNFIFSYRRRQHEKVQIGKSTYLDETNMIKSVIDLFGAGTETVSSTIV